MKPKFLLGLLLLSAAPLTPALQSVAHARPANVKTYTPKPGSRERTAIMNALRVPVQKFLKGKRPTFTEVSNFRVGGGWAFLDATTVDSKGKYLGIPEFTSSLSALLHLEKGKWRVLEWDYFTDVGWHSWAVEHPSVPLNILGMTPRDLAIIKDTMESIKREEREEKRKK